MRVNDNVEKSYKIGLVFQTIRIIISTYAYNLKYVRLANNRILKFNPGNRCFSN